MGIAQTGFPEKRDTDLEGWLRALPVFAEECLAVCGDDTFLDNWNLVPVAAWPLPRSQPCTGQPFPNPPFLHFYLWGAVQVYLLP